MKNERELETILRKMVLRHPPVGLDDRIGRIAAARPERRGWVLGLATMGGLAACIALMSSAMSVRHEPDEAGVNSPMAGAASERVEDDGDGLGPVRIEQRWWSVVDGGIVMTEEEVALRQWRVLDLVRTVWVDPSSNVRIEVTVPREEVWFVPAVVF